MEEQYNRHHIARQKKFNIEDSVWAKDYRSGAPKQAPGEVVQQCGNRLYDISVDGQIWKRHVNQLGLSVSSNPNIIETPTEVVELPLLPMSRSAYVAEEASSMLPTTTVEARPPQSMDTSTTTTTPVLQAIAGERLTRSRRPLERLMTAAKSIDGQRGGEGKTSQVKRAKGKNSHQQQRNRKVIDQDPKCSMKPVGLEQTEELRSPVVSSEGYDEWETARSEQILNLLIVSPHFCNGTFPLCNEFPCIALPRLNAKVDPCPSVSIVLKTAKAPVARVCPHPIAATTVTTLIATVGRKDATDGLAGLEISDIAGVAVVDDHSVDVVSADQNDDFEEVLNKRAKKQKAHEMQAKLDAEEKRKAREKERQERTQVKKRARYNNMKKAMTVNCYIFTSVVSQDGNVVPIVRDETSVLR
ncbi:unnamed protein product [Haemonchus placei]|uniref:Tudor domain-containing protein n=1 Tax=Haemonchus placei TaxID=6290 RepID=A0A0N4W7A8_HAEPC|nr:unnamed protein product [Haemonchus placei]